MLRIAGAGTALAVFIYFFGAGAQLGPVEKKALHPRAAKAASKLPAALDTAAAKHGVNVRFTLQRKAGAHVRAEHGGRARHHGEHRAQQGVQAWLTIKKPGENGLP
eukprot:2079513-Prymnesium_polylepis.1